MGQDSKIEWTHHTFNPWIGCTKVAEGCAHCYAEAFAKRTGKAKWGPQGTRVKTSEDNWRQLLKWNREAESAGQRRRVFCASLADIFEEWSGEVVDHHGRRLAISDGKLVGRDVSLSRAADLRRLANRSRANAGLQVDPAPRERWATLDDVRRDLFKLIDTVTDVDLLLLTKRPENILKMWPVIDRESAEASTLLENFHRAVDARIAAGGHLSPAASEHVAFQNELASHSYRPNVWLGTSIANQDDANRNLPYLTQCRELCPVLFVSAEPLCGPADLTPWLDAIDLVIVGGESGHHARPMHPDWARSLRDQCVAAGVALFFKQWGEFAPNDALPPMQIGEKRPFVTVKPDGGDRIFQRDGKFTGDSPQECDVWMYRVGKKEAGRLLDGRTWDEMPAVEFAR